jgi:hypothetical protein
MFGEVSRWRVARGERRLTAWQGGRTFHAPEDALYSAKPVDMGNGGEPGHQEEGGRWGKAVFGAAVPIHLT